MNSLLTPRLRWLLWTFALFLWIAVAIFPLSTGLTRAAGVALGAIVWIGLIIQVWPHRGMRSILVVISVLGLAFAVAPARKQTDLEGLRADYLAGLQRYRGANYFWGGESPKGIDCSGLIRRGLIDALFLRSMRTLDPGLLRQSINLWWHDSTAEALGKGAGGWTKPVLQAPSLNTLDSAQILPGDLAVTSTGVHILAYLGGQRWIEADPEVGRVITVDAPAPGNIWFQGRMNVVRWRLLQP